MVGKESKTRTKNNGGITKFWECVIIEKKQRKIREMVSSVNVLHFR